MKLTAAQNKVLDYLQTNFIYVFSMEGGKFSFGEDKDNTCARVYITATCRSLIKRNLGEIEFCSVEGSLDNCVGILRRKE